MKKLLPLIVIVGPTAVGKTEIGVKVAQKINGAIISGDSMQVYRYMDIGTAKPTMDEMGGIQHYLIDCINPDEEFNAAIFQNLVDKHMISIHNNGNLPIIVGGTGLYIRSVIDYYDFTPPGENQVKRRELRKLSDVQGNEPLVKMLKQVDPVSAGRIHPNDTRRLIRALEVYYSTGLPLSNFQYHTESLPPKFNLAYFGLTMDRGKLYQRIEKRVDAMISRGLVNEVNKLLEMGYGAYHSSMQAIGYKEIIDYLNGVYSLKEAVELIKRNTRRFAKRQLTWFRKDSRIKWKDVESYTNLDEIANEIVDESEGQFW
ncbi:tRNA (adenosine(37)-N6)-dimethylallyltransferase MiaA [Phosphitispora sp. TUW77]|uniref:tRNA (adenosine(37)-N6)-dimethylallyltransferase MiaA n=1 Tax=Phosphitispora sp. TUW77 TaxID=3152361 RepID=UPI003AB81DA7